MMRLAQFTSVFLLAQLGMVNPLAAERADGTSSNLSLQALTILKENCFNCHNPRKKRGGLILTTREALLAGTEDGPIVRPGSAEESRLTELLQPDADPHMPPKKQLSDSAIATLRAWIAADVPWHDLPDETRESLSSDALNAFPEPFRPLFALAVSPDAKQFAVGRADQVEFYEFQDSVPKLQRTWKESRDAIQSLAWSSEGTWSAAGEYRRIVLWKTGSSEPAFEWTSRLTGRVTAVQFASTNRLVAADGMPGNQSALSVWELGRSEPLIAWPAHEDSILALAISPDGQLIASAGIDKFVRIWKFPSEAGADGDDAASSVAAPVASFEGHAGHIWALAFNTNATLLASGGADRELKIWDVQSREQTNTISNFPATITGIAWAPDANQIVASLADGTIRLAEITAKRPQKSWGTQAEPLVQFAHSRGPDRLSFGAASTGNVYVWNKDGKLQHTISSPALAQAHQTNAAPDATNAQAASGEPVSFTRDILPVLSKAGCNAGKCHAKPEGQNGFKLSVFAYDPAGDYNEIVTDARGRRIFPAYPSESLILQKPTLGMEHEGGLRFERDSPEYRLIERWISQGMPYSSTNEPALVSIDVSPAERSYAKGEKQQLKVQAHYADGSIRDVTALAEYESTDKEIATVDGTGLVQTGTINGETAVVARFMGSVAISRLLIPPDRKLPDALYSALPVNNFIDELAHARFKKLGLFPSDSCTDAEFIRRSSLDITGTLPSVDAVRQFLASADPDKRRKWIDRLLAHPAYADYWAGKWADLIRPNPDRVGVKSVFVLDQWLRQSFRENKPMNQFAREILTAQGSTHQNGPTVLFRDRREPADVTTLVSQVFLGVRLECAKCHHHPNEKWSQDDFYQFAAYFGEIKRKGTGISPPISGDFEVIYHAPGGEVKHPVTGTVMQPTPLGGSHAEVTTGTDPRQALASWVTDPDNPFFARAIVNRVWAELFGRGLVDPVDDFRASNPAAHPDLLDALARHFATTGYDLKELIRTIAASNLYQLSSLPNEHNIADTRNFSRSYRRRLPAEVLADAVADVTGVPASFQGLPAGARAKNTWNYKIPSELLDAFGRPNSSSDCPCERDTRASVVQALHLMHSNDLQNRIASSAGRAAALAKTELPTKEIITELYLAAFSRYPSPEELSLASRAFTAPDATRQSAVEDILWALINSAEFVFNH